MTQLRKNVEIIDRSTARLVEVFDAFAACARGFSAIRHEYLEKIGFVGRQGAARELRWKQASLKLQEEKRL